MSNFLSVHSFYVKEHVFVFYTVHDKHRNQLFDTKSTNSLAVTISSIITQYDSSALKFL
jgi:hypothetical protein